MQWAPLLLLLLLAVAAVQPLICMRKDRYGSTMENLKKQAWLREENVTCNKEGTAICGRWLVKNDYHFTDPDKPHYFKWRDFYGGCYDGGTTHAGHWQTSLVRKYCADSHSHKCATTQFFVYGMGHKPAYLCCCHTDMCDVSNLYAYAEQQGTPSAPKPPSGPTQNYTCEASMRKATTPDGLLNATAVYEHDETCEAEWAPCVEFVYKNEADGQWRLWRAGCSYNYSSVNYADMVKQFCAESGSCAKLDMVEPEGHARHDAYTFLDTYACCCSDSNCTMPDTIGYAKGTYVPTTPSTPTSTSSTSLATSSASGSPLLSTSGGPPPSTLAEMECSVSDGVCEPRVCYRLYRGEKQQQLKEFGCIEKLTAVPQQMVAAVCGSQDDNYCFMTTDVNKHHVRLCCCSTDNCNKGRLIVD